MSRKEPIGGWLAIEIELRAEAAAALKRQGQMLDRQLAALRELRELLPRLSGPERQRKTEEYRELRKQAEHRRWCLVVQREAMGIYHHDVLDQVYPVPPNLDSFVT